MSSEYRLSPAAALRLTGGVAVLAGALVLLLAALVSWASAPQVLLTVGLVLAIAALAVVATVSTKAGIVGLDEAGYRVRLVRGAGVTQARWRDVEDVVATTVAGERCVQLRLRDGRATIIPVDLLAGGTDAFVRDLQDHLTQGHGYRPLR